MSDKRFAYWGMFDSGKFHVIHTFLKNGKITTFFKHHYYYTNYPIEQNEDGYKYERIYTYKKPNENKLSRTVNRIFEMRFDAKDTRDLWTYNGFTNFVDDRLYYSFPENDGSMDDKMYEQHHILPDLKNAYDRVIDESSIILQPERLLGFTDRYHIIIDGIKDLHYSFQEEITERLKTEIINVVPYKTNLIDWTTTKLNQTDFNRWGCKDLFDAYKKNKLIVWRCLDEFLLESRNLERILRNNNINYKYFNLDNDSYLDYFDLKYEFPDNFTHLTYEIETGHSVWDEDAHKRYNQLLKIAEHYIHEKNITDLRLDGADKDGIK